MVGVSKRGLIMMVFIQSFMFVLPAIVLAFVFSIPTLGLGYYFVFEDSLGEGVDTFPTFKAILFAIFVGVLIPILSSIIPLIEVMSQNLNDALNYQRTRVKAVYIEIYKKNS